MEYVPLEVSQIPNIYRQGIVMTVQKIIVRCNNLNKLIYPEKMAWKVGEKILHVLVVEINTIIVFEWPGRKAFIYHMITGASFTKRKPSPA